MIKKLATLAAAVTMAVTLGACSGMDYYDNAYSGPAYVIGH